MSGKYDDIIHLPHHVSTRRHAMARIDRAAQFSPFAALTGYEAAVRETARLTETWTEPDEDRKAELDRALREAAQSGQTVRITYFHPDGKKDGGAYLEAMGEIKRLDAGMWVVVLREGRTVALDFIVDVSDAEKGGDDG